MMIALSAKNKLEFVDGGAAEPLKIDRTYGAWKRSNKQILTWKYRKYRAKDVVVLYNRIEAIEVFENVKD